MRADGNEPLSRHALAFVLAGGRGSRLMELTDRRAKPAVYFGGKSRIIDFALSNAMNSGIRRIAVATQYKAHSLIRHLQMGWNFFRPERNESFDILPASQRVTETNWYLGTADAVYQNIDIIESYGARFIVVLAGDHVYKMDYEFMLQQHVQQRADVTIGCLEMPRSESSGFGVMQVDDKDMIESFLEKPANPPAMPGKPDKSLASMGIYVFDTKFLFDELQRDANDPNSSHDFGKDIIPYIVKHGRAVAHQFSRSCVRSGNDPRSYWRDVGTVDAYWASNIDLTDILPELDLYDRSWPIWTHAEITPPAKFVHDKDGRRGEAVTSLVSGGCIVSGAALQRSLLFTGVHLHSYAKVKNAVILPYVDVGQHARLKNVVIDRGVRIPGGACGRRRPRVGCETIPYHRARHLPDHAGDDRRAGDMSAMRVLSVASEIYPIIKTGGLADVVGALPIALKTEGVEVRTLIPGYPAVMAALEAAQEIYHLPHLHGGLARVLSGRCAGIELFVLDAPHLFARPGNPYATSDGVDWPDNAIRFAALGRIASDIGLGSIAGFVPDIVHAHDWQAGLTHAYLHYSGRPKPGTVMTVHNLAYQGQFPRAILNEIGLPPESFDIDGVEYYGGVGFLKAGLQLADRITTVSPTYAMEIRRPDAGMGLDGLLRGRSDVLSGILNGIDIAVWNPGTDPHIASTFGAGNLENRAPNKAALQKRLGLRITPDAFLIGVISRMSWQKGLDLLIEALPGVMSEPMQIAVLGNGDAELQDRYKAAATANPDQVGVWVGYDEGLAHLIQAGADALVVPSRFEPCGLTQLCALRYGSVPIVSRVGGLADTVVGADDPYSADRAMTGIKFGPTTTETLAEALRRANVLFRNKAVWRQIQQNGMAVDVSWRNRASGYAELYRDILKKP